jgi:hypothetical protein
MTTERTCAAILMALFACFLLIALFDLLELFEAGRFGDTPLMLFCIVVCAGWIGFLANLVRLPASDRSRLAPFSEH